MALTFSYELALGAMTKATVSHEPTNAFWKYGIDASSKLLMNSYYPINGEYADVSWDPPTEVFTVRNIIDIQVKNVPKFSAFGFYTTADGKSYVLPAIHNGGVPTDKLNPSILISGFDIAITFPRKSYDCYRVDIVDPTGLQEEGVYYTEDYYTPLDIAITTALVAPYTIKITGFRNEISIRSQMYELAVNA